eukprot:scaffold3504_cov240-Pinguiococcus_pyrenoidosus.AAC.34
MGSSHSSWSKGMRRARRVGEHVDSDACIAFCSDCTACAQSTFLVDASATSVDEGPTLDENGFSGRSTDTRRTMMYDRSPTLCT